MLSTPPLSGLALFTRILQAKDTVRSIASALIFPVLGRNLGQGVRGGFSNSFSQYARSTGISVSKTSQVMVWSTV